MPYIINLSEAVLIAVHAMAAVAAKKDGHLSTREIGAILKSSESHIAKVMQRLVRGGLLNSSRGPDGGFALRKKPEEISILDIFNVIEGEYKAGGCSFRRDRCIFKNCLFEDKIRRVEEDFIEFMRNKTLDKCLGEQ